MDDGIRKESQQMNGRFSLVLGTNMWTHHQAPLARELLALLGPQKFRMAIFDNVDSERRTMGWDEHRNLPWVIGPPANEYEEKALTKACVDADVMLFGACPETLLKARAEAGKLTLVQSERMLKKRFHGFRMLNPRYARGIRNFRTMVDHPHVHALAIGQYAPDDLRMMNAFGDRIWRWGYFVELNRERPSCVENRPLRIMWAGRMLWWKNVEVLIKAIKRIQDEPWFGDCTIIGDGAKRESLEALAWRLRLKPGKIRFERSIPFEEIRKRMRRSDVYVLPSNRHEGWGAVAGEAMSEGCVLVANEMAGASRQLVKHGETGFLFRDGDAMQLASILERVGTDYQLRMSVREKAWEMMQALWNPRVAAERLVSLSCALLGKTAFPDYPEGPCSRVSYSSH